MIHGTIPEKHFRSADSGMEVARIWMMTVKQTKVI